MEGRPAIVHLDERVEGDVARVALTLAWEDEHYEGEAVGDAALAARPRLAGEAALRAVEEVTRGRLDLHLAAVGTAEIGPAQIALAHVRVGGTGKSLVGNAVLGENDATLASVKAVLNAINRPLGSWIGS